MGHECSSGQLQSTRQKHVIFDPIPRLEGIEPSDDPFWNYAPVYLISGRRRREA